MASIFYGVLDELLRADFVPDFREVNEVVLDPIAQDALQLRSVLFGPLVEEGAVLMLERKEFYLARCVCTDDQRDCAGVEASRV